MTPQDSERWVHGWRPTASERAEKAARGDGEFNPGEYDPAVPVKAQEDAEDLPHECGDDCPEVHE